MSEAVELSAALLRGVAALWKKTNREIAVRFGGNSMRPTIAPGQEVTMRCTDDVSVGDVIVYIYLDQVVVHRLIARGKRWLLTRGDAHTLPDPPLEDVSAIVGKIVGVAPPPRTMLRSIAATVTKITGVFGPRAIRASIAVMKALR